MFSDPSIRVTIGGVLAMAAAMGIGRFVYTPILPGMMQEIPLGAGQAGVIASANFVGYLLGALVGAGGWAEGRELAVLRLSLLLNAVFLGAMGLTESIAMFSAIRFLGGIVSAFVLIFASSILFARITSAGRPGLAGLHFSGVGVGIAVSAVLTGALFVGGASWRDGWFLSGAVCLALFLSSFALIEEGPAAGSRRTPEPPLPASRPLRRAILAYGLFGFGYVVTATFLVAIVREGEASRLAETAVWLVAGLAAIPSIQVFAALARRAGLGRAYAAGFVVQAAGVAASVTVPGLCGPLLAGLLLGSTIVAITASGIQVGRALAPHSQRRVMALMTAAFGLGQIVGPLVGGYLAEWTGGFAAPSLLAAAGLLAGAAMTWTVETTPNSP